MPVYVTEAVARDNIGRRSDIASVYAVYLTKTRLSKQGLYEKGGIDR